MFVAFLDELMCAGDEGQRVDVVELEVSGCTGVPVRIHTSAVT